MSLTDRELRRRIDALRKERDDCYAIAFGHDDPAVRKQYRDRLWEVHDELNVLAKVVGQRELEARELLKQRDEL